MKPLNTRTTRNDTKKKPADGVPNTGRVKLVKISLSLPSGVIDVYDLHLGVKI
jgi:hypothetical protein